MELFIDEISFEKIYMIQPLWQDLNALHHQCSINFKNRYETLTFEKRMENIDLKRHNGEVRVFLLKNSKVDAAAGFCICSIAAGHGEIDSIFIKNEYRKQGWGGRLMEKALQWFDENRIADIRIDVVYANDEALPFYERYGFNIWAYRLRRK